MFVQLPYNREEGWQATPEKEGRAIDRKSAPRDSQSPLLADRQVAHLVVSGHRILSPRTTEGLDVDAEETSDGIRARVVVREDVRIEQPVHLCFGIVHR